MQQMQSAPAYNPADLHNIISTEVKRQVDEYKLQMVPLIADEVKRMMDERPSTPGPAAVAPSARGKKDRAVRDAEMEV